jgi:hypothetical protein
MTVSSKKENQMSLEKNLETALNRGKLRLKVTRLEEDKEVIVVELTRNNNTLFGAMTNEEGAKALLDELSKE